ncbi:MAG: glucose-6-phosphate dehydrogenase [Verrucomicrobiae bacterium]|nr:glucose-6-phosphate dehydrogenase [Verrucomicrobiae bacterium]MCX7723002.1 glucose-6-phosphate dehydrogenase [Verrucomicrobiae bacterium]MDW7979703.1 glucose-6-phosphate dehydrogenase [Verrucomicrobiales bacterium]
MRVPGRSLVSDCRLDTQPKQVEPCTFVIFGASGDLTSRKLVPALYSLHRHGRLPSPFRVLGCARRAKSDESWRAELREALGRSHRAQPVDAGAWETFAGSVFYCQGDLAEPGTYARLRERIAESSDARLTRNLLFYLATPPDQFGIVVEQLYRSGLIRDESVGSRTRVVVEKPLGHDLVSARRLNELLSRYLGESQILRIDHYLGKETVQNIVVLRFANALFERVWSRDVVDHVQITVAESSGVGTRGAYYEQAGALRDMVQNHLLQVLALVAMEPPVSLEAEAIRDEKVKLLRSVRPIMPEEIGRCVARGQYTAGVVSGRAQCGYRQEAGVNPGSSVETFAALRLFVDNWRWAGVPFYLRTGKCLPIDASEVWIQFRRAPEVLFTARCGPRLDANALVLRLQPGEGVTLLVNGKVPGLELVLRTVRVQFKYAAEFGAYTPEAYERLLLDAMSGDTTLFLRADEVEAAWQIVDPVLRAWADKPLSESEFYPAGTWGPASAEELIACGGHAWRVPQPD